MAQQRHRKNNENQTEKFGKKKKSRPLSRNNFCLIGTPSNSQERKKTNSRASLLASYADRPSRDHLATDSVRVRFSSLFYHSEPRRPPHVKPGAHRAPRSPARQCWCSGCVCLSANFSLVRKNKHRLKLSCNPERPLKPRTYSTQHHIWRPGRAHSFSPRVSRHTRRLATKMATALLATPPLPASIR